MRHPEREELLHDHCLVLNRVQRRGDAGEPVWGALDTVRL
ncbi:hypothetical protein HNR57_007919, partial [Streptomyces paradoxus]|nr:hypothetical protein [Streptomyces paradoxus]